jgi:glycosyltransferase involved in cell wall biosynthesis
MDSKPAIAVLSCFYEPYISGAERFVKEVVERLSSQYNFFVVTARLDRKSPKKEIKKIQGADYEIRRLGLGLKIDKWLYIILAPFYARACRPRVVHAVMESYAGLALVFYRWFGGRAKTILTLQSGDLDSERKQAKIPGFLWRNIHTLPDYVTAISSFLKERAIRLGAKPENVSIIPNGVDLKKIKTNREPVPHRIVSVARLSWEKGLNYLISAFPRVQKEFSNTHLIIVGGGPLEKELKRQVEELGVAGSVKFLGNQSHNRVLEEISKAEVFITPSLAEGLGIVFIEAQAVGVPVIGTEVGGIPDVIQDGETGLLIPPRDQEEIFVAITKLFKNQNLAEQLTENAKKNLNRFDWDVIAGQVSDLYYSLV